MEKQLKEKLEKVVELVNQNATDPDIDIDYCIPEVATTSDTCEVNKEPYIVVRYTTQENDVHERKIKLRKNYLEKSPQDLANLITFYIEQFIEEINSVEYGGE